MQGGILSILDSLCYILLPRIFDFVRGGKNKSIVVVVSPLKDQVSEMGHSAAVTSDKESASSTVKNRIKNGEFYKSCISVYVMEWKNTSS